jgi:competence protein ComGC
LYFVYKKQKKGYNFIFLKDLKQVFRYNSYLFYLRLFLICLILINFILILADPNIANVKENIKKNGIDIVMVLDIS